MIEQAKQTTIEEYLNKSTIDESKIKFIDLFILLVSNSID